MAILKNPAKARPMSILASDLAGNFEFDSKQTFPVMDMSSGTYDEGMSLYLQTLGIKRLENEYNAAVKLFETQLEEQEIAAKLQANLAAESAANMAVEAQPGLGTGAAAVASEGRQDALGSVYGTIEQNTAQAYQEGMQNLSENYQTELESILGKYDPATQTFAGLQEYETMSNSATEAIAKVIAKLINPDSTDYETTLTDAGIIENSGVPGEFVFTDFGHMEVDALINSVDANDRKSILGDKTILKAMAEEMGKAEYNIAGDTAWDSLSESKRDSITREYASWIHNNLDNLRLSAWDLYEKTDSGYVLDTAFEVPRLSYSIPGVESTGIYVDRLTMENVTDCDNDTELSEVKREILSGTIPDGSFFVFQRNEMYDDDKYYYVKNNTVYKTDYTAKNPPPVISAESATVRSFGIYRDSGKGEAQDKLVKRIIDCAKAGKIPDNTYIHFGYESESSLTPDAFYKYVDGNFIRVESSDKTVLVDRANDWQNRNDVIYVGSGNAFSSGAKKLLGVTETFMGWGYDAKLNW